MRVTKRDRQAEFLAACQNGHVPIIDHLLSLQETHGKIDIHSDSEFAFQLACVNRHISVVDRLLSLETTHGKIDIHARGDLAFRYACENDHLPILELLLSLEETHGQIDIHAGYEFAFRYACGRGRLATVSKLFSIQYTHGKLSPETLKEYGADLDISQHLEATFSAHTFQEVQFCLVDLTRITIVPEVKSAIRKILSVKAKAQLTERDIASPALRP